MTSAVDDIDRFIADQKSKLAQERQQLNGGLPPQASSRAGGHPTRSKEPHFSTKGGALSPRPVPRGSYDRVRNQLNEERRKEYNHLLQERKLGGGGKMDEGASLPIKDRHSAKTRAMIQRNQEYNDFIRQKEERERRQKALRFGGSRVMSEPDVSPKAIDSMVGPDAPIYPPQNVRDSHDDHNVDYRKRMKDESSQTQSSQPYYDNRGPPPARGGDMTFGERPLPPRQGWRTPVDNYDELLRRKREEEARYRRHQEEPYYGRSSSMRPAFSDSHLARSYDEDEKLTSRKMDHLDQEYDTRKVRFRDEAIRQGAISSSDVPDRARYDNRAPYNWGESSSGRRRSLEEADSRPPYRGAPTRGGARSAPIDDDGLGLKLGERDSQSAAQRKKEAYRRDLEQQIAEAREAKRREKQRERNAELSVNASGERDPEKFADRLKNLPPQESKPRFDPINHAAVQEKPNYARAQPRTSSLLEQPLDLGSYPTSQLNPNDPYVYYGLRDPLDPETAKTDNKYPPPPTWLQGSTAPNMQQLLLQQQQQLQAQQQLFQQTKQLMPDAGKLGGGPPIGMAYGQQGVIPGTVPMVPAGSGIVGGVPGGLSGGLPGGILNPRGPELTRQDTAILRGESAIINYVGDEQLSPRHQQDPKSYQQELLEQMRERELKRKKEKEEEDRYNRKLEAEARSYDPWGKGGGGAPMKDVKGNIVADLRQLHNINEGVSGSGTGQLYSDVPLPNVSPRPSYNPGINGQSEQPPTLELSAAFADASKPTFARGNVWNLENEDPNKIAQGKTAQDSYKDYLQQQVDEKRRRDAEEKEKIRLEEEREEKRLQAEREKMQKEFEEEQERQRRKEEEARLRNEQLILAAEDKRKEIERQRREEENRRLEEMRRNEDEERQKKYAENAARVASPPIPTLRNKAEEFDEIPVHVDKSVTPETVYNPRNGRLTNSPPIPSSRSRVGDNKDVIHALSAMRRQLHSEQKRIQQQLENREYDAYDPVPGARYRKRTPQVDVFEMARNKEAVYPRRTSTEPANTNTVAEFTELKHRNGKSRQEFRSLYPEHPNSNSTLETQQNALIQQQEEKLNAIRRGRITTAQDMPSMRPLDLGLGRESPSMPLPSESAFVNANTGETEIPSPLGYKPSSARQRRRARDIPSPSLKQADPLGSVTSFDVDALASKNKERLRKLKQLEVDGDSLADPDEVLKRFMAKTSHDRPVSATSQDAWLRPSATDAY
uniref:Centrosome and spindle pole-associated protein 1-like n=1 Tax=Saccoglossus kowalevskii TaxID=10224 RepID=A0ABM0M4X7_SACKO|nr:PREDICTED: centrosome and spindle pole-associated protein 1-like [Saccoglossus kowalevskii]